MAMIDVTDIPSGHRRTVYVPAVSAGTDKKYPLFEADKDLTVTKAVFIPSADITGADTDTMSVKVINAGDDGSGTTLIASKAYTDGVDATALVPEDLTLSSTAANLEVDEGEVVVYLNDQSGTSGLAAPIGVVEIEFHYR